MKKNFVWMAIITTIGVIGLGNIVISNAEIAREQKRIEKEQKAEEEKKEMEQVQVNNTVVTEQPKVEEVAPTQTEQPKQETTPPPTNNGGSETPIPQPPPTQPIQSGGEGRMHWISKDNLQGITIVSSHVKEGNNIRTTHTITNNYHFKGTFTNIDISHNINSGGCSQITKGTKISIKSGETKTFEVLLENVNIESVVDYKTSIVRILAVLD
ncbi:MAG: hypothetical protein ACRDD7_18155 [Peptostreptococcaceae bacterium]